MHRRGVSRTDEYAQGVSPERMSMYRGGGVSRMDEYARGGGYLQNR